MGFSADVRARFTADGSDGFTVDAAIDVRRGESLAILGPSGSGKTLLLETVAGFHTHDGTVRWDGQPLQDLPPERRNFGFVFQEYALFPHMTVRENVEYGTRYHDEIGNVDRLLEALGVDDIATRYPPTLSGGEKQRVALARARAVKPQVMLLDEPLSSLDVPTRQSLREDLADVLADVTAVYVTHNRTTARAIADRIAVMFDGEIVQTGDPKTVFERPCSRRVAEFTGANTVDLERAPSLRSYLGIERGATVSIRPEAIGLAEGEGELTGTVERVVREDATSRVTLDIDGATIDAFSEQYWPVGETVSVSIPTDRVHRL
ncbi:ABC transporter ATP-binding protein [Halanaeroarchaeum sulfurireducens]|uniref:Molybdate/tungstate import ATP-binding protein WtpC n=1 Tax=Halanaeroarchaeum sulfurireducens TaxID=1604004 RepID=A0A0F7PBC4_9EURY|nr:ABC transporter ATP-binding protein [Halanaeroarchaeum sulfurireducens]AKH97465.1 spermidine/putrescine ABC transporter ATPase component [Halanaeroarchaeum sulfurireducens]ALG81861.1 spermidine/putrescine ABC transporter ATPase component [Halanaeroarchaeum sulfurireducens]